MVNGDRLCMERGLVVLLEGHDLFEDVRLDAGVPVDIPLPQEVVRKVGGDLGNGVGVSLTWNGNGVFIIV